MGKRLVVSILTEEWPDEPISIEPHQWREESGQVVSDDQIELMARVMEKELRLKIPEAPVVIRRMLAALEGKKWLTDTD